MKMVKDPKNHGYIAGYRIITRFFNEGLGSSGCCGGVVQFAIDEATHR